MATSKRGRPRSKPRAPNRAHPRGKVNRPTTAERGPVRGRAAKRPKGAPPTRAQATKRRAAATATPRHAAEVFDTLTLLYPEAHCELDHRSPWQLLVATILSAQCTDKRVNMVTPALFAAYPAPADLARAPLDDVERIIKSTGFFRAKARAIVGVASALVDWHHDAVPNQMEQLIVLPGVGRKTANVVLGNAFGINEGVVVDTHVARLARRLGLTKEQDPVKIERDLMALFPRERWTLLSHLLIWHGRRICDARTPRCGDCSLRSICPTSTV